MGESEADFRGTEAGRDKAMCGMKQQENEEDFGGDGEIDGEVLNNASQGGRFIIAEDHERRRDL